MGELKGRALASSIRGFRFNLLIPRRRGMRGQKCGGGAQRGRGCREQAKGLVCGAGR